jgi:hypothetical protein
MMNKPPFDIVRWVKTPLITGSATLTDTEAFHKQSHYFLGSTAPSSHKLHHSVVYPCGLVRKGDRWLAGCGINDIASGVLEFETKEITKSL